MGCLERLSRTVAHLIGGIPRTGHVSAYMLDVAYSTGCPPAADHNPYWCPALEVYPKFLLQPTTDIFALPPRAPYVAVRSAHWNRGFLPVFLLLVPPQPRPVHSRWLDLCVEWALFGATISPQDFF